MNRLKPEEKVFQFLDNHGVRLRALKKHETKKILSEILYKWKGCFWKITFLILKPN